MTTAHGITDSTGSLSFFRDTDTGRGLHVDRAEMGAKEADPLRDVNWKIQFSQVPMSTFVGSDGTDNTTADKFSVLALKLWHLGVPRYEYVTAYGSHGKYRIHCRPFDVILAGGKVFVYKHGKLTRR